MYPNLKVHDAAYPAPATLKAKIRYGNIDFDGDISHDSPGSALIKSLMLDDKPGPLFITAWGGQSTIARALKSIQEQYEYTTQWETIKQNVSRKVVLLPSGDQDDTYATYIQPNWPQIEYRQFSGGPNYGYGAQLGARPENAPYLTADWMKQNVSNRGPLGALYRVWGDGKQMVRGDRLDYFGLAGYTDEELKRMGYTVWLPVQAKGSWLGEGDNHTFMNLLGNGLRAYEAGWYGGWGGRVPRQASTNSPFSALTSLDTSASAMATGLRTVNTQMGQTTEQMVYPNFFPPAQNSFAARLKWSVTPRYADANHEPVVRIMGPLTVAAVAGQPIKLYGAVSDPDGNAVSVRWWIFPMESYPHRVAITNPDSLQPDVLIPQDVKAGQTIHLILEATDNGTPSLTKYQRVIVMIK